MSTTQNRDSAKLQDLEKCEDTRTVYRDLENEVEALDSRSPHIKDRIENIKIKFVTLLDLCGIKDADIPIFDEPNTVRFTYQTLITSFGVMSKKLPYTTPRRHRRARYDISTYADMLIEQLLLAQANSITDSDTSPPRAENIAQEVTLMDSELHGNNNNDKVVSLDVNSPSHCQPNSGDMPPVPIPNCHTCEEKKIDVQQITTASPSQGVLYQSSSNRGRLTHSHNTTDSGMAGSDQSLGAAMCTCGPAQQIEDSNCNKNSGFVLNRTSGSTPELPTSESTTSLDIPFASFFDFIDFPDCFRSHPIEGDLAPELLHCSSESGYLQNSQAEEFPAGYSEADARQFTAIGSEAAHSCRTSPECPARSSPGYSYFRPACSHEQEKSNHPDQADFIFCEPLVVSLPPLSKKLSDKHDLNINKSYKPHLGDKNADVLGSDCERPPIPPRRPITEPKLRKSVQYEGITPTSLAGSSHYDDLAQCSCRKNQAHYQSSSMSGISYDFSPRNTSWSYHHLPDAPENSMVSRPVGRPHHQKERNFVTVRSKQSPEVIQPRFGSASKRRKGNDKIALPADSNHRVKSARQRLLFTSPARPRDADFTSSDSDVEHTLNFHTKDRTTRTKAEPAPAFDRLIKQKENKSTPPTHSNRLTRQPFAELYNNRFSDSNAFTMSSNSFSDSPKMYYVNQSSDTSPDVCLPSRDEELRDRDAYYCDFTVDRQHKIDDFISRKSVFSSNEDNESQYTQEESVTQESLIRNVEGAECSPSSYVFQAPTSTLRAPKAAVHVLWQQIQGSKVSARSIDRKRPVRMKYVSSNSSSQGYPHFTSSSSSYSNNQQGTKSVSLSSRASSKSSGSSKKSSAHKTCTSHPIASSTLIMDSSPSPDRKTENVRPVYERSSPYNTRRKHENKFSNNPNIYTPTMGGRDNPTHLSHNVKHTRTSEIAAMVSRFEEAMTPCRQVVRMPDTTPGTSTSSSSDVQGPTARTSVNTLSDRRILAAAQSFLKAVNTDSSSGSQQYSEISSGQSSNQVTTSSMLLNYAKASIVCTSSEGSSIPEDVRLSFELSHSRHKSASEPYMLSQYIRDIEEGTLSLVPTDSSELDSRPDIPGRSNTSSSSSCTAARCRPRTVSLKTLSHAAPPSHPTECISSQDQDLLDSILTDSPKSVDSSGIYVPHNSYNSPVNSVNSVGSHNGYSSTVSSSVSTDTNGITTRGLAATPSTPHTGSTAEKHTATFVATSQLRTEKQSDNSEFKRPFTPSPHVDHTLTPRTTRNQGVNANCLSSTPHGTMSVQSDPLSRNSVFAVPPGVVTGPPKIKDKNSLVRKFKKFSSNFYKKTEKIQTLANL